MDQNEIIVGMGRYAVAYGPAVLTCLGLGSCVGVLLYDKVRKMAGLAHIMLPKIDSIQVDPGQKRLFLCMNSSLSLDQVKGAAKEEGVEIVGESSDAEELLRKYGAVKPGFVLLDATLNHPETIDKLIETDKKATIVLANVEHGDMSCLNLLNDKLYNILFNPITGTKMKDAVKSVYYKAYLKYANVAIGIMLMQMFNEGCKKSDIVAKIAGGSHMFQSLNDTSIADIGKRNAEAVEEVLGAEGIPILAKDVGGGVGRTVRFNIEKEVFTMKTVEGEKVL